MLESQTDVPYSTVNSTKHIKLGGLVNVTKAAGICSLGYMKVLQKAYWKIEWKISSF